MRKKADLIVADLKKYNANYLKIELEGSLGRRVNGNVEDTYQARLRWLNMLPDELRRSITYSGDFYDGGDTEFTVTVPAEMLYLTPELLKAFNKLAKFYGRDSVGLEYAGMHLSVLPTGQYSRYEGPVIAPHNKLRHFQLQLDKMMPALYLWAAHSKITRSVTPRPPGVRYSSKYAAIGLHEGRCLEYRVFDPCYHEPDRIIDNFGVIAKTLQYMDKTYTPTGVQSGVNMPRGSWGPIRRGKISPRVWREVELIRPKWARVSTLHRRIA
jgi:hypothetical protein